VLSLVLGVSFALVVVTSVVLRRVWPKHRRLTDEEARARLATMRAGEVPEPLRAGVPRPDVFSGRGYLRQKQMQGRYLDLLTYGRVARGLCISRWLEPDSPGVDITYEVAWIDYQNRLRRVGGTEYHEGLHTGPPRFTGPIHVVTDARLREGRVVTVVYASVSDACVIYEALGIDEKAR
jgi:hypothetical protein